MRYPLRAPTERGAKTLDAAADVEEMILELLFVRQADAVLTRNLLATKPSPVLLELGPRQAR